MNDEIYLLWLSTLTRLGSVKRNLLLEEFGSARSIYDASASLLRSVDGITERNAEEILLNRDMDKIERLIADMEARNIVFVSRFHERFPSLLKCIPDAPVGVYYIGSLPDDTNRFVGVIGSRRCSEYGLSAARMLSRELARYGVVIVSGMARGIDGIAHKGAIEGGSVTIAVMGCGPDICYPSSHRALREDIIRNGCVLSEFPPGTEPLPMNFPLRNRIISGLSTALVVAEAAKRSGTLITVGQAIDQGREVMAVPGSILSKLSEGTNALIRDGAQPVTSADDILAFLGIPKKAVVKPERTAAKDALAPEEQIVYDSLSFEPSAFEVLAIRTQNTVQRLHYICTMLELKGLIRKLPGSRYVKNI